VRLRAIFLIFLVGLFAFQAAEARDPRARTLQPQQKYRTAGSRKAKNKKFKAKKVKYGKAKHKNHA